LLRLTLLAPDIVETILEGRQPKGMQLEEKQMPSEVDAAADSAPFPGSPAMRQTLSKPGGKHPVIRKANGELWGFDSPLEKAALPVLRDKSGRPSVAVA
jgi:hypothetical protein